MPILGKPMKAIRRTGSYVRGKWVNNVNDTLVGDDGASIVNEDREMLVNGSDDVIINFRGSVRPIKPDTERYEPEGRVVVSALVLYSTERLLIAQPGGPTKGDLIEWEGMRYEVVREYPWQNTIIPHWKYIIAYLEPVDEE